MCSTEQLNTADVHEILGNCLNTSDFRYVNHSLRSLSEDVEGYLSEHYSLDVQYITVGDDIQSKTFFVKALLNADTFLAAMSKELSAFERESFVYNRLFKQFEQFPSYTKIAPKCYLARDNLIVLEDLKLEGFTVGERLKYYNLRQCQISLETLAHYHAYGIIMEERLSQEKSYRLNTAFPDEFTDKMLIGNLSTQFHQASYTCLLELIDQLMADHQTEFKQMLRAFQEDEATDVERYDGNYRSTCVHGDLWSHNIMFNGEDACRLVDFQMLRYTLPAFDVQLFFYGNTSTAFRVKHKAELLQHYYASLKSVLAANGVDVGDILTFNQFTDTCTLKGPEAKMQAVNDIALLHLPKELLHKAVGDPDFFKSLLLEQRSHFVMELVRENPQFKILMVAELRELFSLLKQRQSLLESVQSIRKQH